MKRFTLTNPCLSIQERLWKKRLRGLIWRKGEFHWRDEAEGTCSDLRRLHCADCKPRSHPGWLRESGEPAIIVLSFHDGYGWGLWWLWLLRGRWWLPPISISGTIHAHCTCKFIFQFFLWLVHDASTSGPISHIDRVHTYYLILAPVPFWLQFRLVRLCKFA